MRPPLRARSHCAGKRLRDQNATLAAVEDRGARNGDYGVISFSGTRDGEPFEGGSAERMPIILGQERLIPGFEAHLVGLQVGGRTEFDITFPADYPETELAGIYHIVPEGKPDSAGPVFAVNADLRESANLEIASNQDLIKNPDLIHPGQVLKIPQD